MNSNSHTLTRGNKQFELCNHLGNVLVTVQDRKRSVDVNADNQADYYLPYLRTVTNYYAYGSAMPGIGGSIKECTVTSTNLTLEKYPYFHTFSNDSTSGFTAGSGARSVTNPTHNVLHLESIWTTRPLANKTIYLKNGVNYALKFNLAGFSVVSGYTHTVKVRILLPGNTLSYTYTATGNQTINFTSNTTGNVTIEISSQITGSGTYSINPYIDIDNFNLSWDSAYTAYVNTCGSYPENYKYGFNTQEKDNEIAGENNLYTAEYWEYDARIARRWNVDPVFKEFESPYACFGGNPIFFNDVFGDDIKPTNIKGKPTITANLLVRFDPRLGWSDQQKMNYLNLIQTAITSTYGSLQYQGNNVKLNISVTMYNGSAVYGENNDSKTSNSENTVLVDVGQSQNGGNTISNALKLGGYMYLNNGNNAQDAAHEFGHILGLSDRYTETVSYNGDANPRSNRNGSDFLLPVPPRSTTISLATIKGDKSFNANTNLMSSPTGQTVITNKQLNVIFRGTILTARFGERNYYRPVIARDFNAANSETNYNQIKTRNYIFFKTVEAYNNGVRYNNPIQNSLIYYSYSKIFGLRQHKDKGEDDPGFIYNIDSTKQKDNRGYIKAAWDIGHK